MNSKSIFCSAGLSNKKAAARWRPLKSKNSKDAIIDATGPVIGQARHITVDRLIYVSPEQYAGLKISERTNWHGSSAD
jgi:hypothetical protein